MAKLQSIDLQNIVNSNFGIEANPIEELERFDLSNVRVYTKYPEDFTVNNYGYFEMQKFEGGKDELYKLIVCGEDFPNNSELVSAMVNEERLDVKEYELVEPIKPIKGYFLYKLTPFTVQGVPVWS